MQRPPQQTIYDDHGRPEVAALIPVGAKTVLDVGCGPGGFGRSLRARLGGAARIEGIEAVPTQAALARIDHGFDKVHDGYFPGDLPPDCGPYDLMVFNDVLEHMWDPWDVLRQAASHLRPGGHVLAAIPSIQYLPELIRIVRGRWDYTDGGTLDRTHVRFFAKTNMIEMLEDAGYRVEECVPANSMFQFARYRRLKPLRRLLGDMEWMHFVLRARFEASP